VSKLLQFFIGIAMLCYLQITYAAGTSSISFFASNNADVIKPQQAYERLLSEAQDQLNTTMVEVMQSNHMEQSKSEDIIGMYQMESGRNVTADNTKMFTTSPYQIISNTKAFELAKELAKALKQESVAVFIPDADASISDTVIHLKSHPYHLDETLKLINETLPHEYSQAFSIHLGNKLGGYENTTISSIEWLGSKIDPKVIHKIFPKEEMLSRHGKTFLVFKNGQKEEI